MVQNLLDGRDEEILRQDTPLTAAEEAMLVDAITRQREPSVIEALVALLRAGRGPRRIVDAIQVAAAQVILETGHPNNFSMAQHGYEYCNTVGWFYDTFAHPHRLKLLFVAGSFINRAAEHQANTPDNGRRAIARAGGGRRVVARARSSSVWRPPCSRCARTTRWPSPPRTSRAASTARRSQVLASAASILGNDPHNQELGLCLLEDYGRTSATAASGSCWPARGTPRGTASTATRSRRTAASPRRSTCRPADLRGPVRRARSGN